MNALYSEKDLSSLRRQISRRLLILLIIFLIAAAAIAATLVIDDHKENRPELLTTLILIFSFSGMIFFYDMLIHPLSAYARHVENALHGRSHEVKVECMGIARSRLIRYAECGIVVV